MPAPDKCGGSYVECLSTKMAKINSKSLLFHYLPMAGAASYGTLSVNVMNPSLIMRMSPSRDITNILLGVSVAGSLLYIYDRPHLRSSPPSKRILYSGFGAVIFNFGSVLVWAVLRSSTRSNCIATIIGLASGAGLALAGLNYLQFIDQITDKPST
ncbi:hypothetical protein GE061_016315 [Apolygus lucorum]|uniref:Uncharacterized protein n=1 Tax=Apolygus lucorum TaxID=248454 RepID=A0A6A4K168_APOLU|nr:hypothetical protein GE061_016315 [Apolygus lucorum]